jgi:choline dehydrogenase-like flavoprotein
MATSLTPQNTDFSRDVFGRYICNGLDEARNSTIKDAIPNVRAARPDARDFDVIVVGGGSFGAVVAQHLFFADKAHRHRILVLEGGPFVISEHVQNLPMLGLGVPGATSIQQLRQDGQFGLDKPREQVWGLPWHSSTTFPGLAYCLGGRSLFFGGWSPQLLDTELSATRWPSAVINNLSNRYFREASEQIGTNATNDFISGSLHEALRQILLNGINTVTDAIPLSQLPLYLDNVPAGQENLFKLEAPLAVQSNVPRSGFYPFNKFSTAPLLMKAARAAQSGANNDDVKKRLMIVPNCHVTRLVRTGDRVSEVQTSLGNITVPASGVVVIALGTIESTRLALASFGDTPNANLMGQNLMAHLRSNLDIRVPREALPPGVAQELQASALFVKGQHQHMDGSFGHFHLQITASGLGAMGADSEAELFKKVPDIDGFAAFQNITDSHVVITIRGIGEMEPQNPNSSVRLDPELDEFSLPRAIVAISDPMLEPRNPQTQKDFDLWKAMDRASDQVAKLFANGQSFEVFTPDPNKGVRGIVKVQPSDDLEAVLPYDYKDPQKQKFGRRDGLGTTHHEAGTLWMGDNPNTSVTNADGRFHAVANAYVAGPALFPTIGSPNPMLTGVALARRLGDVLGQPQPYTPEPGFTALFNGFDTKKWRMSTIKNQAPNQSNPGNFIVVDGTLESVPGNDLGLYWYTEPLPADFILKLEWLRWGDRDNSGVFIRFPNPGSQDYSNTAYVGVNFGFEVQIDEYSQPNDDPKSKTGAIYSFAAPKDRSTILPAGQWQEFEIRVQGQSYTVLLNGEQVTAFTFTGDPAFPDRGLAEPRFVGLQAYPGSRVAFRKIRFQAL